MHGKKDRAERRIAIGAAGRDIVSAIVSAQVTQETERGRRMHVDVIDNLPKFEAVRANWDAVYDADPEAHFFLSWTWMADWLARLEGPWFILAAKAQAKAPAYAAFLPLRLRVKERRGGGFYNEINMAGNYAADYTGLICRREAEAEAVRAFAKHLMRLNWTHLNLDNFAASERRMRLLLDQFPARTVHIEEIERINEKDKINNCICPYVALPDDWEKYLNERLSANTRQKIRRFLRQVESDAQFRITLADADTVERDVKTLLRLWATKWAARKGSRINALIRGNYATLMRAFGRGTLFLPVLWKGDAPVGALASFIDVRKKAVLFYMAGRDETFGTPPPGLVLHAYSIRFAIAQGFTTYDFLRGNEPYKYSFGVEERRIRCFRVSTRSGRNLGDRLDKRSVAEVLARSTELHQAGKFAEAERGYRQILEVAPRDPAVLYRFGQLMATTGDHAAARRLFRTLVAVRPESYKAWLGLAQSLQARGQLPEAAGAYREVIKRRPETVVAHRNLGSVLVKLGRHAEAVTALAAAQSLQPAARVADGALAQVGE